MEDISLGQRYTSQQLKDLTRLSATVVLRHAALGNQPDTTELRFSTICKSEEDPYRRKVRVTNEPMPLDLGYVKNPRLILLANKTGNRWQTIPTPEEILEVQNAVVRVRYSSSGNGLLIRPGSCILVEIESSEDLVVECLSASIPAELHIQAIAD